MGIEIESWLKSSLIVRNTLYRGLKDHPSVLEYPDVRGMHKNVFFVSHTNREAGGGEDSVSKHNEYEVRLSDWVNRADTHSLARSI